MDNEAYDSDEEFANDGDEQDTLGFTDHVREAFSTSNDVVQGWGKWVWRKTTSVGASAYWYLGMGSLLLVVPVVVLSNFEAEKRNEAMMIRQQQRGGGGPPGMMGGPPPTAGGRPAAANPSAGLPGYTPAPSK